MTRLYDGFQAECNNRTELPQGWSYADAWFTVQNTVRRLCILRGPGYLGAAGRTDPGTNPPSPPPTHTRIRNPTRLPPSSVRYLPLRAASCVFQISRRHCARALRRSKACNCMKSGFAKLTIEIFFTAPTCLVWRVGRPLAVSTTVVLA